LPIIPINIALIISSAAIIFKVLACIVVFLKGQQTAVLFITAVLSPILGIV
jgi:hypothetical protein